MSSSAKPPSKPKPNSKSSTVAQNRRILCLALRYVVSNKEYAFLRRKVLMKQSTLSSITPKRSEFESIVGTSEADNYLPAATRASVRVLVLTNILLNSWDAITARLQARKKAAGTKSSPLNYRGNFASAASLAVLVLAHRVLYRFFTTLRANLSLPQARAFRVKYPRIAKVLLSPLSPSVAASLSGCALAIHPSGERRTTIAVWALVKALEFNYNRLEDDGWFQNRPWWFGSWLLVPISSAQLFHSFVFDRGTSSSNIGSFISTYLSAYLPARPESYPKSLPWPNTAEVVGSVSQIAALHYPPFSSPILFPNNPPLSPSLSSVTPVISPAHPSITSLQCALLHPTEPSCLKTYIHHWATSLPRFFRFIAIVYTLGALPRYRSLLADPTAAVARILTSATKTSIFITGSIGSGWAALCLFQKFLPRNLLPEARFYLAGALGGLWAAADRGQGRGNFLYGFRLALLSAWNGAKKRGLVRGVKNGDVWLFVAALAAVNVVYDMDAGTVSGAAARRVLSSVRGKGLRDVVKEKAEIQGNVGKEKL